MNANNWIEKYKPTRLRDIVCNRNSVGEICEWIHKFDSNKKIYMNDNKNNKKKQNFASLLITGRHGTGKTISTKLALKQLGYTIETINFGGLIKEQVTKDYIKRILISTDIISTIDFKTKKSAILVDEIESITTETEKKALIDLQKINNENWFCPIIFISNDNKRI